MYHDDEGDGGWETVRVCLIPPTPHAPEAGRQCLKSAMKILQPSRSIFVHEIKGAEGGDGKVVMESR